MLRVRPKRYNLTVYLAFIICISLVVSLFLARVITGSDVTKMSVGQVILTSQDYELGEVFDRNGKLIVKGNGDEAVWSSDDAKTAFQDIMGIDIAETLGSRTTVLGNCPWVFGADDNRFTWDHLIHPGAKKTGGSVMLTLDSDLQEYVSDLISESGYENAYVLVSNYKTGEMLAIYGNVFSDTLHPGSALKPILAAAALSLNPGLADYTYDCTPENHSFKTEDGPLTVNCANGASHGTMNMKNALAYSCNGFFVSLMQQMDKEAILTVLNQWGWDTTVSYNQFMYWDHSFVKGSKSDTHYLLAAIGQANAYITPAGLNFCTNTLLNHGQLVEPVWFTEKKPSPGSDWQSIIERADPKAVCSSEAADRVVSMMNAVTEYGTGRSFNLSGFAAKTGTAQKSDINGNLSGLYTVWTTGGLTCEETPYSITVCIDNVTGDVESADAGQIAKKILLYLC